MIKWSGILLVTATILWSFACGYWLGASHQKVKYIVKETEVVKKVTQKKAAIYSRPNINRNTALKLMRRNEL